MDIVDLIARMDDRLARIDEREAAAAARHEALLAKMDERLENQHTLLVKMDEHLAAQDQILERLAVMIDHAREEAAAARQMQTLAMQRFTDTRLDVDRFLATAARVLARWEQQGR